MSHELRTPLNAILGFAQLMQRDTTLNQEQRNNLATINRSGDHLLTLINDVLEISRIESGRVKKIETNFNLHEMLMGIEEMVRIRAKSKDFELQFKYGDDLPLYVRGDDRKLRQVLINLLNNAVKFTDQGSVILGVETEHRDRQTALRFSVTDTGVGIPPDEQADIFKPFVQVIVNEHSGEGSGLGLAISYEFVHILGGELKLESKPAQGSSFFFTVPLEIITEGGLEKSLPTEHAIELEKGQPDYRILIAEDQADNRRLLSTLLDHLGFKVKEATNGEQAVQIFKTWHPHLVWMDMRMPVMDGYEATKIIKSKVSGKQTPVLALTASAFEEDRERILASGCDGFVRKPLKENDIIESLIQHLGVRFRYEEIQTMFPLDKSFSRQALSQLPDALMAELLKAAIHLDIEAMNKLADQVARYSVDLADTINTLSGGFRFDLIQKAVQEALQRDKL
jgi:CheY-like chemotaxis protein